jgi:hypothetical protein
MLLLDTTWNQYQDDSVTEKNDRDVILGPVLEVFAWTDRIAKKVQDEINNPNGRVIILTGIHKSDGDNQLHITLSLPDLREKYHLRVKLVDGHWRYAYLVDPQHANTVGGSGTTINGVQIKSYEGLRRAVRANNPCRLFVEEQQKDFDDGFQTKGRGNKT